MFLIFAALDLLAHRDLPLYTPGLCLVSESFRLGWLRGDSPENPAEESAAVPKKRPTNQATLSLGVSS